MNICKTTNVPTLMFQHSHMYNTRQHTANPCDTTRRGKGGALGELSPVTFITTNYTNFLKFLNFSDA